MKLLTKANLTALPALGTTHFDTGPEPVAVVKFFTPDSNWTWYASEFDGQDTFFGLVDGFEKELGYFSLAELESLTGPFGLHIERDRYFTPTNIKDLM